MPIATRDIVPLSQALARLSELAEEAHRGAEKVITRNGEAYVALIDAARLGHDHRLEREHIHLRLLDEAEVRTVASAGRTALSLDRPRRQRKEESP